MRTQTTACCIVGGGPAGIILGLLLARRGVEVVVLEKHADFLRDFRGDTIHPSTLQLMQELGLREQLLALPHQRIEQISVRVGGHPVQIADFRHLPTRTPFVALMPQWDFLNFLVTEARRFPTFQLRLEAEVEELLVEEGRVAGVRGHDREGHFEVRALLTVGADGRDSVVRARAGLEVKQLGAPIDVLWMPLPRRADDPTQTLGYVERGHVVVMLQRPESWQCGYVIAKGGIERLRAAGLAELRRSLVEAVPFLRDRLDAVASWDDVKLLTVRIDRLRRWHRPGLLCLGDAAHAMSPVGGVGINLAIQDAVAAANLLAKPLRAGDVGPHTLARVQRRRELPTRWTQAVQVAIQRKVLAPALRRTPRSIPWGFRLLNRVPPLRRIPGWLVGWGLRPEHAGPPAPQ